MLKKLFLTKWQVCELIQFFWLVFSKAYACSIYDTQADQLLPQLLMEQFDTFPSHYRQIGHLHLEV